MIVYEVTSHVDAEVADAYRAWLPPHVAEILALPGFLGATMAEGEGPNGLVSFWTSFHLVDHAALDAYVRDHAPRLRGDAQARFGGRFESHRRVGRVLPPLG